MHLELERTPLILYPSFFVRRDRDSELLLSKHCALRKTPLLKYGMLGGANAQTVHFTNARFVYVKRSFSEARVHFADGGDLKTTFVPCPGQHI